MKKFVLTLATAGILATGGLVLADGACSAGAEKVAKSDCAAACSGAEKVAMKSDCATACSGAEKVAMSEGDVLNMAKGGAEGSAVKTGYGLGHKVPDFTLTDASGKSYNLADTKGNPTVLVFYNHQCPFVVEVDQRLSDFTAKYAEKGVTTWAIDAGINNSVEDIGKHDAKYAFPILVDRSSQLAVNFAATRTPEVFVLCADGVVQYHGMFDTGQNTDAEGNRTAYAQQAVEALLAGKAPEVTQTKAFGCTIKFNPDSKKAAMGGEKKDKKDWKKAPAADSLAATN